MDSRFLGRIPFTTALTFESDAFAAVRAAATNRLGATDVSGAGNRTDAFTGVLLGFESEPVITCGVRAGAEDLILDRTALEVRGFSICEVERGGQATIHNPGQLVIFPVVDIRAIGVRVWVERLASITADCLREFGVKSEWRSESPGLYTKRGKIMACGVRIRSGISTHGISINVSNNLADFALIRACGISGAPIDRMGESFDLETVFNVWCAKFRAAQG